MAGDRAGELLDQEIHTFYQTRILIFLGWLTGLAGFISLLGIFSKLEIANELSMRNLDLGAFEFAEKGGLALGALILGWGADRFGRRPLLIISMTLMVTGVLYATLAHNLIFHTLARGLSAFGVGGLLVCTTLLVAEYSCLRWRAFCLILISFVGSLIGAITGSLLMGSIMDSSDGDWRLMAYACSSLILISMGLTWVFLPESIHWLSTRKSLYAGNRIQQILLRIGHRPDIAQTEFNIGSVPNSLFAAALRRGWQLLLAIFIVAFNLNFLLRGVLRELNTGSPSGFGMLLSWFNLGSITGIIILLILLVRVEAKTLTLWALLFSGILYLLITANPPVLGTAPVSLVLLGAFSNAGYVGLMALLAMTLPTSIRGSGRGIMQMLGEGVKVLAPIITTLFLGTAFGFFAIWTLMGAGSLLAAWLLFRSCRTSRTWSA